MANEITITPVADLERMAKSIVASKLFGVDNVDKAIALMCIAQAEGLHPATAAMDYDIIQNKPAKKPQAMLRDYLRNNGKVEWHEHTDKLVSATFSHPAGGSIKIDWDLDRAKAAGLAGKDNWKKYPRQMLRARVISEGVRATFPGATGGMYSTEEVQDFDDKPAMKDVTPQKTIDPKEVAAIMEPLKAELFDTDGKRTLYVNKIIQLFESSLTLDALKEAGKTEKGFWEKLKASHNPLDAEAYKDMLAFYKEREAVIKAAAVETKGDSLDEF
tara:strand:- start:622 stop:1440 length:819 start_codon:yes stop_codon:yes gene_type:complete